jgi:putative transposase
MTSCILIVSGYSGYMKLTLQTQLIPDADQTIALKATVERFNEAANWVSGQLFEAGVTNKRKAQQLVYRELRDRFLLTAQTAILVIHHVCEALKRDRSIRPVFRPHAAITYDARVLRFIGLDKVNLWTLAGRLVIPILMGSYQAERIGHARGQCDLILREDGQWFLMVTIEVPEATPLDPQGFIGVDLGIANLAATDDGETFSGDDVEKCRRKYHRTRRSKESRYRKDVNHCINKRIVEKAKGTASTIGVEDLAGISGRTTARKADRSRMKGWAFFQLRAFMTYKAALAGIPVIPVDPRDTSRTCSACGHCEKKNRKTRDIFECKSCGFALRASKSGRDSSASPQALAVGLLPESMAVHA